MTLQHELFETEHQKQIAVAAFDAKIADLKQRLSRQTVKPVMEFRYNGKPRTLINYTVDAQKGLISGFEIEEGMIKNYRSDRALQVQFNNKMV